MNEESNPINKSDSGSSDEDSYIKFENEKLTKEIMKEAAKKQQKGEEAPLPDYMKELQAPIDNQVFHQEFHAEIGKPDDIQFFEDDLESDRIYRLSTNRKLIPTETELSDMKSIQKMNTKSTYGSSD